MSFRGTYQNKFRRADGSSPRAKRPFYNDRGRHLRKHYGDSHSRNDRDASKDYVDRRGPASEFQLDRGRGRGRSYRFHAQNTRPFRGRFTNRSHDYRGRLNRNFDSPKQYKSGADDLDDEYWSAEEDQLLVDNSRITFKERSSSRLHGGFEEEEEFGDEEHIPLERPGQSISPLIIHRRFDSNELLDTHDKSLDRRSLTPLNDAPSEHFKEGIKDRGNYSKRSGIHLSRSKSGSPFNEGVTKRSIERSISFSKRHRESRSLSAGSLERERSAVERQLTYEKKRRQMLEHQRRRHEKRSELSIERFLDDCKRSFEENLRPTTPVRRSRDKSYQRSVSREPQHLESRYGRKSDSPSSLRHSSHKHSPIGGHRYHHLERNYETSYTKRKCRRRKRSDGRELPLGIDHSFERRHDSGRREKNFSESFRPPGDCRMSLSPISQRSLDGCQLDLSPISADESFGVTKTSARKLCGYKHNTSLSPVSDSKESNRQCGSHVKSTMSNIDRTERPKSNDSMQEFLAELERSCERSRSSSERSFLRYKQALREHENSNEFVNEKDFKKLDDNKYKSYSKYDDRVNSFTRNDINRQNTNTTRIIENNSRDTRFSNTSSFPDLLQPSHDPQSVPKIQTDQNVRNLAVPPLVGQQDSHYNNYNAQPVESLLSNSKLHPDPVLHGFNNLYQHGGNLVGPNAFQAPGVMSVPFPPPMFYSPPVVMPSYHVPMPEGPSNFTHYQNVLIIQNQTAPGHQIPKIVNSNQLVRNIPTLGNQYSNKITEITPSTGMYNNATGIPANNTSFAYSSDILNDKAPQQAAEKSIKINPNQNPRNLIIPGEAKHEHNAGISQYEPERKYQPSTITSGTVVPHDSTKESRPFSSFPKATVDKKFNFKSYIDLKNYLGKTFQPGYLSELKDVIVVSDDDSESEHNNDLKQIFPDHEFINRFRESPPPHEELAKYFKEFVIFFGVRNNSELEKDPFIVIQDSFATSNRFGSLDVEDLTETQDFLPVPKQVCVLRWRGVALARASDYNREKAREKAAITLINSLAHICHTIQAKYSYYCGGVLPKSMLSELEKPGEYKIIKSDDMINAVKSTLNALKEKGVDKKYCQGRGVDAAHIRVVLNFIDEFFKNKRRHCELIFGGKSMEFTMGELDTIARHAEGVSWLQWRSIRGKGRGLYTAVSRRFTPQQLHDFLLDAGGETMRYKLLPPQPAWIELLMSNCHYSPNITKTLPGVLPPQDESNTQFKRSSWGNYQGQGQKWGNYQGQGQKRGNYQGQKRGKWM